jgi:hypothetical protein
MLPCSCLRHLSSYVGLYLHAHCDYPTETLPHRDGCLQRHPSCGAHQDLQPTHPGPLFRQVLLLLLPGLREAQVSDLKCQVKRDSQILCMYVVVVVVVSIIMWTFLTNMSYGVMSCSRLEYIRPTLLALYRSACLHRDDMNQVSCTKTLSLANIILCNAMHDTLYQL